MSRRVNEALAAFSPEVEVYSIDETFLGLSGVAARGLRDLCKDMRATVRRWTGIPTCVGVGPTKTLAKLGNAEAKRSPAFGGVCDLMDERVRAVVLRAFPVEDVWGVGPATAAKLAALGVTTAAGLRDLPAKQARALGTVTLERTVLELRGLPCLALEELPPPRKGLAVTRSFGRPVTGLDEMREAVAAHAARAGEKLRAHALVAGRLSAFFHTSQFREDGPWHHAQRAARLVPATADTRDLIGAALRCVEAAWREGLAYVKAGVMLEELCPPEAAPSTLFGAPRPGTERLMAAVDRINERHGRDTVFPAAMGVERGWAARAARRTPRYTTRIGELPKVVA